MKLKKKELILILILVALLALTALWPKKTGNLVDISVDGRNVLTVVLDDSGTYSVPDYEGYHLRVVVKDGSVWVEDSNCPDLICQKHAPISKGGEQIVCLPHRLVVEVTGEEVQADATAG